MLRNENYERLRQKFVDQFEPDGQGFLYRKFMRDAPIPVSAAERNRYIATFDKARKYQIWGTLAGTLALIISLTAYDVTTGTKPPDAALYVGLGVMLLAFMASYYWVWYLPARELRDRGAVGEARSRAEMRRVVLAKTTYGQLAAAAGVGVMLLVGAHGRGNMLSGWNLLFTCLGIAAVVMSPVQAFRKWRFEADGGGIGGAQGRN